MGKAYNMGGEGKGYGTPRILFLKYCRKECVIKNKYDFHKMSTLLDLVITFEIFLSTMGTPKQRLPSPIKLNSARSSCTYPI